MSAQLSLRDHRHVDKLFYLGQSKLFYELNVDHYIPTDELLTVVEPMTISSPLSWKIIREGVWTHVARMADGGGPMPLPRQGWKIHVSATNQNCIAILGIAAAVLVERGVPFKFANDIETLTLMTSKRWRRGGSGKFVTVYPRDDAQFVETIELLYDRLSGFVGSYILSDKRYRDSRCLYYRYGGIIAENERTIFGQKQPVLRGPDGTSVKDQRNPWFETPAWAVDPIPDDDTDAADDGAEQVEINDGRYRIDEAIGFSNTGGVYLAHDNHTGRKVVLKEARPGVELSLGGEDAVDRLKQEASILQDLHGTDIAPQVFETFHDWENFYVAMEYLDADPMRIVMLSESPLLRVRPTLEHSQRYYRLYVGMIVDLIRAVKVLHERGIVIGDLSPVNIMIDRSDKKVRLIDLEGAFSPASGQIKDLHTPGFRPYVEGRSGGSGFALDMYAIGAVMLYSMFPLAAMSFLRSDLYTSVLPMVAADIGWTDTPVVEVAQRLVRNDIDYDEAIRLLSAGAIVASPLKQPLSRVIARQSALPLASMRAQILDFIVGNVRLGPKHTLFPIDPFGKDTNKLGFGFGATGVMHVLRGAGVEVPEEAQIRYRREMAAIKMDELPPGLMVGAAGLAWASFNAGDLDEGRRLLQAANNDALVDAHDSLYYGRAGVGLVNLLAYRLTGDDRYLTQAERFAAALRDSAREDERGVYWQTDGKTSLGFAYGQSGIALFLLRMSQVSGDPDWRALGLRALRYDLSYAHELEPGIASFAAEPQITHTYEPYIEAGTAGIAKVALRYGLLDEIDPLLLNARRKYSGFTGLIYGLAGFVDVLIDAYRYTGSAKYLEWAERPLRGLYDLYLFESNGGWALPGDNLFRITCDYATGVAGVAAMLQRRMDLSGDDLCLDVLDEQDRAK